MPKELAHLCAFTKLLSKPTSARDFIFIMLHHLGVLYQIIIFQTKTMENHQIRRSSYNKVILNKMC